MSHLTPKARELLSVLARSGEELTMCNGEWWTPTRRWPASCCMLLLRLCLMRPQYASRDDYEVFVINEEGREMLRDANYTPIILRRLGDSASSTKE